MGNPAIVARAATSTLKDRVRTGELVIGLFLQMGSPVAADIAGRVGFDWVLIDLEHGAGTEADLLPQLLALAATSTPALVRVESGARLRIGRALDLGACGIVLPQVNDAAAAADFARNLRYPPAGARGVALSARGAGYGSIAHGEIGRIDEGILGVAQIETVLAIKNVDEIAAVDGIDVLFVGPSDLSHSLGVPGQFDDPVYMNALKRIAEAATEHSKVLGVHVPGSAELTRYRTLGFTFVSAAADGGLLSAGLRSIVAAARAT